MKGDGILQTAIHVSGDTAPGEIEFDSHELESDPGELQSLRGITQVNGSIHFGIRGSGGDGGGRRGGLGRWFRFRRQDIVRGFCKNELAGLWNKYTENQKDITESDGRRTRKQVSSGVGQNGL